MTALTNALQAVLDAQHNTLALADPSAAQALAMTAWMQEVTSQIDMLQAGQAASGSGAAVAQGAIPDVSLLVEAAVQAQLPVIEQQIASAFGKILTAQAPAPAPAPIVSTQEAPPSTEPPTITPSNPA
ncbi:hypothetical protein [Paraburkholderia phenazinium]|uniref:Killing trait domain-containing protein n=1 Tax=Paraburkholderia phenazinium TaxID=60549 RepID=A0A1N6KPR5_9BURK|nr:hypothetical protein [Paraburkholderia phenazinium]SIO58366.1 hypothetical protein SAMN05444165_4118 [Paraburkholderia phenazinium]